MKTGPAQKKSGTLLSEAILRLADGPKKSSGAEGLGGGKKK